MSSEIFNNIAKDKINSFIFSFCETSEKIFISSENNRLIHPAEFGKYREEVVKDLIKLFIPGNLDIGDGFIITMKNEVSTQIDIVIYDKNNTPLISSRNLQKFFPVETVVAIIEIKSILSRENFIEALRKLSKVKQLRKSTENPTFIRRNIGGTFNPTTNPQDHIFSAIICKKLNFNLSNIENEFDTIYGEIEPYDRHNLILSIDDGILMYNFKGVDLSSISKDIPSEKILNAEPVVNNIKLANSYIPLKESDRHEHIKTFLNYINRSLSKCTIIYPELIKYFEGFNTIK